MDDRECLLVRLEEAGGVRAEAADLSLPALERHVSRAEVRDAVARLRVEANAGAWLLDVDLLAAWVPGGVAN